MRARKFCKSWQLNDASYGPRHTRTHSLRNKYHSRIMHGLLLILSLITRNTEWETFRIKYLCTFLTLTCARSLSHTHTRNGTRGSVYRDEIMWCVGKLCIVNAYYSATTLWWMLCTHGRIDFFDINFEPPPSPHFPVNALRQEWKTVHVAALFVAKALHSQPLDNIYFANGIFVSLIHHARTFTYKLYTNKCIMCR